MKGSLAAMITLISLCAYANVFAGMEIPKVPPGHPRVYVRPSDLPSIREKIENPEFSKAWESVKESDYMLCKAFVYMVAGDAEAGRQAIGEWMEDYDKRKDNPDQVGRVFFNLMHTGACIYDWCYDLLTEEEKAEFIKRFEEAASSHGPGYPANPDL